MAKKSRIILATPHRRYDSLEADLRSLGRYDVIRVRSKEDLTIDAMNLLNPSYAFFPHWSWRIPETILTRYECIIFHMTDLPFGRGGSPLQNLIVRGIESTQLSALRCENVVDAGPIYLKAPLSTLGTAEEVFLRAARLMLPMIIQIVDARLSPSPQTGDATAFERRRPEQGNLDQAQSLVEVHDLIRMLDAEGYPNAFLDVGPLRLQFSRASLKSESIAADVVFRWRNDEAMG
jgi:methionyl-tRNA formyltransferase